MKKETILLIAALAIYGGCLIWYNNRKPDPTKIY